MKPLNLDPGLLFLWVLTMRIGRATAFKYISPKSWLNRLRMHYFALVKQSRAKSLAILQDKIAPHHSALSV